VTEIEHVRATLRAKRVVEPPAPWRSRPLWIAGITAVGFPPGSDLVVVLSHSGVGVVDPFTTEVVARSYEDPDDDPYPVSVPGIGPFEGMTIPVAGLWGGGLRAFAPDGWWLSVIAPDWPGEKVVLIPPGGDDPAVDPEAALVILDDDVPVRAAGFSDSGRVLVAATTSLSLWTRDEVAADG
jgi:hypothetical protein